ncbi:MAG: VOC family protein [Pseudomonadota bacterium]
MSEQSKKGPKAEDLAFVRFQAPDLSIMRNFLEDFGLRVAEVEGPGGEPVLYSRGTDGSPYVHILQQGEPDFLGLGFKMASRADLDALAQMEGASDIEEIDAPGGGLRVRFEDPNGNLIDGVFGVEEFVDTPPAVRAPLNTMSARLRLNEPVRLQPGRPIPVNRIGHCVLNVRDFQASRAWYEQRFGFLVSEEIFVGDKSNVVGSFFRTDRGRIPTDHHTIFLVQSEQSGVNHVAFEVDDWDSLMLGHDYLASRGYQSHWGVGKHILGSQVFDYWEDPYGNVLEHFTDGDLFDASHIPTQESVDALLGVQWGPRPPERDL